MPIGESSLFESLPALRQTHFTLEKDIKFFPIRTGSTLLSAGHGTLNHTDLDLYVLLDELAEMFAMAAIWVPAAAGTMGGMV